MKFSTIFLAGITSTAHTDDLALSTLTNLETISSKIFSSVNQSTKAITGKENGEQNSIIIVTECIGALTFVEQNMMKQTKKLT